MNVEYQHDPQSPDGDQELNGQLRRYREERRRRIVQSRRAQRCPTGHSSEADEIIRFAQIWAPYGGASAEETFSIFGISIPRFVDKLWEAVHEAGCDSTVVSQLAHVYPTRTPVEGKDSRSSDRFVVGTLIAVQ
ncbi:hypothetical protein SAMN04490220_0736 [Rhodococcus jostii]|uniref:Uncharacterized protein n=1 Tax=Rhodococcus jostii TaxID=132919 RepID=A0A1H4J9S6_RHOJO|nr:hypothetical protein SAMN04490220_0736 [Rhodococcus jostii]